MTSCIPGTALRRGQTVAAPVRCDRYGSWDRVSEMSLNALTLDEERGTHSPLNGYWFLGTWNPIKIGLFTCTESMDPRAGTPVRLQYLGGLGPHPCEPTDFIQSETREVAVETPAFFIGLRTSELAAYLARSGPDVERQLRGIMPVAPMGAPPGSGVYANVFEAGRSVGGSRLRGPFPYAPDGQRAYDRPASQERVADDDDTIRAIRGTVANLTDWSNVYATEAKRRAIEESMRTGSNMVPIVQPLTTSAVMAMNNDGATMMVNKSDELDAAMSVIKVAVRMTGDSEQVARVIGKSKPYKIEGEPIQDYFIQFLDPNITGGNCITATVDVLCQVRVVQDTEKCLKLYTWQWQPLMHRAKGINLDDMLPDTKGRAYDSQYNLQLALQTTQRLMHAMYGAPWVNCLNHIIEPLCVGTYELVLDPFYVTARIEALFYRWRVKVNAANSFECRSGRELVADFLEVVNYAELGLTKKGQEDFETLNKGEKRLLCDKTAPQEERRYEQRRDDRRGGGGEENQRYTNGKSGGRSEEPRATGQPTNGGGADTSRATTAHYRTPVYVVPKGVTWDPPATKGPLRACAYHFKFKYQAALKLPTTRDCRSETAPEEHGRCKYLHTKDFVTLQLGATKAAQFVDQSKTGNAEIAAQMAKDPELKRQR